MKLKLIAIVAVLAAGIAAVVAVLSGVANTQAEYEGYLAKARTNAEREIPYVACQNYRKALAMRCEDESIYKEYLHQADLLGGDFYFEALEGYVQSFPMSQEAYDLIVKFYYNAKNYEQVFTYALEAKDKGIATEDVKNMYLECFHMTRVLQDSLDEAQSFLGNIALVKMGGLYGYISENGLFTISPRYQGATAMMSGNAAVDDGTEWYMINNKGYKVARSSEPVDSMSFLSGGWIRVSQNGKYGYINTGMKVPDNLPFDYASIFKNGVAAVRKGDKWALTSNSGEMITDYIFDDVILDEYEACINGGVIIAKQNGSYYFYNAQGERISSTGFDDAVAFCGSQPAAVCLNGKWGFADTTGKIVIEPKYENAGSFNIGLAPVQENGTWGYINTSGVYRIESQYKEGKSFTSNGIAAVKEGDYWMYIKLLAYYY